MENKIFVPEEQLKNFMKEGAMNQQYGIQILCSLHKEKAQELLPPPLKITEPATGYIYIVNIREPSFGPWYMEGGIGIMAQYKDIVGLHFIGLQLSGPGSLMGMCAGREGSGLPKKLCERIHVERLHDHGHCFIERNGIRLIDVELDLGKYNDPKIKHPQENCSIENPITTEGGCLLFRHRIGGETFENIQMIHYDSPTKYYSWEPASAKVTLSSSPDDPWGDVPITGVLSAGWMVSDNWVKSQKIVHEYPDDQAQNIMQYLFSGRYDKCTLYTDHQIYE